jgi:energy-coupling factor transport system permease protein
MLVTWHYRVRNSWMEKVDPRARWIFSFLMLVAITFFWDIRYLLVLFLISFAWYFSARVPFRETRRAWTLVGILLFMMILINTIITGGGASGVIPKNTHTLFTLDGHIFGLVPVHFALAYERVVFAVAQILRVLAISALFVVIPYSMDPRAYGLTFRGLGLPDRFAFSMDLAFRYVPTIARDFSTTLDAQRARGYEIERVKGGIFEQVRRIAPLVVPVTMNSILTGEDVTNAMDLRCFGTQPRTWIYQLKYHWWDFVVIGLGVAIFIASILLNLVFHQGGFWAPALFV